MMDEVRGDRIAGGVLLAAAAGTVIAMAHHPSGMHGPGGHGFGLAETVHAGMILFLGAKLFGLAHFSHRVGFGRPEVLAGSIAYGISAVGHLAAATINGFAVPVLAGRAAHGAIGHDIFAFAWELNQAFARMGVTASGIAVILWSIWLVTRSGWASRALGAAGLVAGAAPIVLLLSGAIRLNVAGAFIGYSISAAWIGAMGAYLLTGRFERDRAL
jgi:hypothetical protein